jgi:hypothetical protein
MLYYDALFSQLGLKTFFGNKRPKVTQSMIKHAENIEKTITARAKAWVNLRSPKQPPKKEYTLPEFDLLIAALDSPLDANPDISGLDEELQLELVAQYLDIRGWLNLNQPAVKLSGGLFAYELPASDTEKLKFLWAADILNNPMILFDLLDAGCLTEVEAMAAREVYPDLVMAIVLEYMQATIQYLIDTPYGALSGWQLAGLSALAGAPVKSFSDIMAWQGNYPANRPGRPEGSKAPQVAMANVTDTQALNAPV